LSKPLPHPVADFPVLPVSTLKLENGLTVVYQHTPATPVAAIDVWVRAGAALEPDPWAGMAHFLEHMIFKGTQRILPGDFDRLVEHRGGMTNAATSYDYAHFFMTTAAQHLEETLPYLAALLLEAAIPDQEFEREREVVLEEIRQSYDSPDCVAFQVLMQTIYQQHAYGRPILGTEETLYGRSPADMRRFHQALYQPENMTVVVVGAISRDRAIESIRQAFQVFPTPPTASPIASSEAEPPLTSIRRQEFCLPRLEQARLLMGWLGPGADIARFGFDRSLRDAYGLDALSVLLTEGRMSRLVRELREERGLVHAISSGFSLQQESGLFSITAWLDPAYLNQVEAIIGDRLAELAAAPVSEAELERCKRLLCNEHAFSTETPSQLAGLYGYYSLIAQPETALSYPQRIQALCPQDLQRLVAQYLSPQRYAAIVVSPAD